MIGSIQVPRERARRPLMEAYAGKQFVGIDLHRRRTITVRRRCRSIPTNCFPAYASIRGLLALSRGTWILPIITLGGAAGAGGGPAPSSHQGPFQHVVAGEGFEPSKLSRWIYRPPTANP